MKTQLILLLFISLSCRSATSLQLSLPTSLEFGQSLSEIEHKLNQYCSHQKTHKIDPPEIPGTKKSQFQIDCYNFNFAGQQRLAEFVFKDDSLYLVWVLIEASELHKVENSMLETYKEASYQSTIFTAFTNKHTALRKDVPEVLFYGDEASESFEIWFKSAAN